MHRINQARRLFKQRHYVYQNARHIDESLIESQKAELLISQPKAPKKNSLCAGINSSFTNSFMNSMFRDTSLDVAQKQKESVIKDQQKKLEKELKRRQFIVDTKQKLCLREYYRKEYGIKVSHKVMEALTVQEFEEYLKRRQHEENVKKSMAVLKTHLLGFVYRKRFKKRFKERVEATKKIQRWYRKNWKYLCLDFKKKRNEAVKVISAHLRGYQVFMQNREFLYKLKLRSNFSYFRGMRDELLTKSQRIICKHWLRIRERIRSRRAYQSDIMKRALRKFTVMIYLKAKRNLEIINHFRKRINNNTSFALN